MKKGFVSTTLVYSFFIVFVFINVIIVLNYTRKLNYLNTINEKVESKIKLNYGMCTSDSDFLLCRIINDNNPVLSDSSVDFTKNSSSTNGEGLLYRTLDSNKIYYYRGKDVNNFVALGISTDTNFDVTNIIEDTKKVVLELLEVILLLELGQYIMENIVMKNVVLIMEV